MALRNIVFSENPLLRKKCRPVEHFDENLWELLDDMKETMRANNGCGLAGPQVAVLRRIAVIESNGMYFELINPQITKMSGSQESNEGCLSVKNVNGLVIRPEKITVKALDRFGYEYTLSVEGFLSTVFCHEIDHLDGILFTDKAEKLFQKGTK